MSRLAPAFLVGACRNDLRTVVQYTVHDGWKAICEAGDRWVRPHGNA